MIHLLPERVHSTKGRVCAWALKRIIDIISKRIGGAVWLMVLFYGKSLPMVVECNTIACCKMNSQMYEGF